MVKNEEQNDVTFDSILTDLVHSLPAECIQDIRDRIPHLAFGFDSDFKITLVLDTNVLFQAVRVKAVDKCETFLEKIASSPLLRVCAPKELEYEIMEKIEIKFPKDKRTRDINIEFAQKQARIILEHIEIIDEVNAQALERARGELGERDPKDVPFLAISFQTNAEGIMTVDNDYENTSAKAWKARDVGRVVTVINKGMICYYATAMSLRILEKIFREIILVVWLELITIVKIAADLIINGFKTVSNVPRFMKIVIIIVAIIFELNTGFFSRTGSKILKFLRDVGQILLDIIKFLVSVSGYIFKGYCILQEYQSMAVREIESLQACK